MGAWLRTTGRAIILAPRERNYWHGSCPCMFGRMNGRQCWALTPSARHLALMAERRNVAAGSVLYGEPDHNCAIRFRIVT
jgi:hypothetical protein